MKKNRQLFLVVAMSVIMLPAFAQSVLLHKEVDDTTVIKFGPNLKNYAHLYFGTGFILGEPDSVGSEIDNTLSANFVIGYRYKLRVTNWFAIGCEMAFNSYNFRMKQDSTKVTPNKILHDKEKISMGNLEGAGYLRFNFGRRGNRIGNFLDLGGYADLRLGGRHYYKDKMDNGNVIQTTITRLNYLNNLNYGAVARIGFNRYVFFGAYRLSDVFVDSYKYPELPRLTIGFQVGIHK